MGSLVELQQHFLSESYPTLLAIESSGATCGVALAKGSCCWTAVNGATHDHSAVLTLLIEAVLQAASVESDSLQAIALSEGPGSYTSLRIGFATAKGIAYAVGCPLIAVPTLELLASLMASRLSPALSPAVLMPMIDARRMEVYTQPYSVGLDPLEAPSARIFDEATAPFFAGYAPAVFGGPGAEKGRDYLETLGLSFLSDVTLTAEALLPLALRRFRQGDFASTAYLEPLYLKEFVAIPAKKKI